MSNTTNDEWLERAKDIAEYWTGTLYEKELLSYIESNDLEALRELVVKAEADAAREEMYNHDLIVGGPAQPIIAINRHFNNLLDDETDIF